MDYIISIIPQMLMGTVDTLRLFFITIVLAIPLGILLAFCRVSSFKLLRDVVRWASFLPSAGYRLLNCCATWWRHMCMCCGARP